MPDTAVPPNLLQHLPECHWHNIASGTAVPMFSGNGYGYHIVIAHAGMDLSDNVHPRITRAAYAAAELLTEAMIETFHETDPESQRYAAEERSNLLACFPPGSPIHVRAIPNGYANRACSKHLPWFEVTTKVGRIVIGCRKRVISIDWSGSDVQTGAEELFPGEDTTRFERTIHAWGCDKATEYLATLLAALPSQP